MGMGMSKPISYYNKECEELSKTIERVYDYFIDISKDFIDEITADIKLYYNTTFKLSSVPVSFDKSSLIYKITLSNPRSSDSDSDSDDNKYLAISSGNTINSSGYSWDSKVTNYSYSQYSCLKVIAYYLSRMLPNTNHDSLTMYFRDTYCLSYMHDNGSLVRDRIDKILKERHY